LFLFTQVTVAGENLRRFCWVGTLALILIAHDAFGQRVSFGSVGGTNLTRDFPVTRDPHVPLSVIEIDRYSNHRGLIAGISVEVDLGRGLSVEGNALHRQLELRLRSVFPDGTIQEGVRTEVGTWEWPILLKYGLPAFRATRPFIEAGPSFRTRHNPVPTEPSQVGGTVGTGVELRFGRFRVSPALRYTRWQYDGDFPRISTKRDQLEFLTGISYVTSVPSWRLGNRKLRFGLIGGVPLTGGLVRLRHPERLEEEQGYLGGLAVELELNRRLSIEVNGLYRPFRAHRYGAVFDSTGLRPDETAFEFTVVTWQFPVLAKYRLLPNTKVEPVLEGGPSFRTAGNLNGYNPSRFGVSAGGGIEWSYRALKIGPVLRYTRWARDANPVRAPLVPASQFIPAPALSSPRTAANQVELLVGLTF
jgi:hypothetical protein